jgi:phage tail sheath protein FI
MAFQISPGVNVSEIDLTTVVPAVSTSIGGIAGAFTWGPVDEIRILANEVELVNTFGKPDNDTANNFFSAANFLSYSNNLKAVRVVGASGFNATTGATAFLVKNQTDYVSNRENGSNGTNTTWIAKYPGALGNSIKAYIIDSGNWNQTAESVRNVIGATGFAPSTSTWAKQTNSYANDEVHVVVYDEDGLFTGTPNTVLEKYSYLSKASDAKTDTGESNYYKTVINNKSNYIWWGNHTTGVTSLGTAWGSALPGSTGFKGATGPIGESFALGQSDNVPADSLLIGTSGRGYTTFLPETLDVNLLISGAASSTVVKSLVSNIAEIKKDCMVFFSPQKSDVVDSVGTEATKIVTYVGTTVNVNSSYAVADSNWKYQYDKYNDAYRWIPCNGDVAGLCARTDQTNDPWFSPAGYNRGIIKNVVKLAWNPSRAERDTIYVSGVNPIVSQAGLGTLLYGDKTALAKPSSFDRINVRRLFIVLEKAIATAAKYSLFELNDEFTRAQFVGLVEPYLRDVKGRRGIYDFKVVCDETNNTPQVIDTNSFVGDIYIKPARSINYIQLNFVAVRTGVEFSEIVGKF